MKRLLILTFICLISAFVKVQGKSSSTPIIYIDGNGVMRWSDTRREASFFGVNYTLPFAHAYRAIGYLGLDRKAAIDKDVYHISRLGLNAYRIHLWDVELTDGQGNLLENEHLDLMDYLIAKLKEPHRPTSGTDIPNETYRRAVSPINMINAICTPIRKLSLHKKPIFMVW